MAFQEKSAWLMAVLAVGTYAVYLTIILGRAASTPLTDVPYVGTLLWTIGVSMTASIVLHILVALASPKDVGKKDQRDREIDRFGQYTGQSFLAIGGLAVLGMSLAELNHFWIANAMYLALVLSSIHGSVARIVAYRRGFQSW